MSKKYQHLADEVEMTDEDGLLRSIEYNPVAEVFFAFNYDDPSDVRKFTYRKPFDEIVRDDSEEIKEYCFGRGNSERRIYPIDIFMHMKNIKEL